MTMTQNKGSSFKSSVYLRIENTTFSHLPALAYFQRTLYPLLSDTEHYTVTKYQQHLTLFPEGQFVAITSVNGEEKVVGSTSTFRIRFDFSHAQHSLQAISAESWLTTHDPLGEWLYGVGLEVHPDYRHKGIGGQLFAARCALVRRLNLRGEITGGMLPGYNDYRDRMSAEEFVWHVAQGKVYCPILSMQLKYGFRVLGVLHDTASENCCSLIARDNPDYVPENLIPVGKPITAETQFKIIDAPIRVQNER